MRYEYPRSEDVGPAYWQRPVNIAQRFCGTCGKVTEQSKGCPCCGSGVSPTTGICRECKDHYGEVWYCDDCGTETDPA